MYDRAIHPKNLWMNQDPLGHAQVDEIYRDNIKKLVDQAPGPSHSSNTKVLDFSPAVMTQVLGKTSKRCGSPGTTMKNSAHLRVRLLARRWVSGDDAA